MDSFRSSLKLSLRRPLSLFALLSVLAGCGGGGGGAFGSETVSLSASPESIAYGGSSRIEWSASSASEFGSSNFGLDDGNYRGGSITDAPGTTTTYELKVSSDSGNTVPGRATVTVAKLTKGVLVVGDPSQAGAAQIAAFLAPLTTGTVTIASSVPAPSASTGVLVVSPTLANGPANRAAVKAWLDAGKGVVLCGTSPRTLATGDASNRDTSAIGSWFLGVSELRNFALNSPGAVRESASGLVRLSVAIRGKDANGSDGLNAYVSDYGPQVDAIVVDGTRSQMCAYQPPSGGRLVWSASTVGFGGEAGIEFQQAFESAFRWAGQ